MFSDTMNSWELGLAPSPLAAFATTTNAKSADVSSDIGFRVGPQSIAEADSLIMPFDDAPLELDIFEQELKRHEEANNTTDELILSNAGAEEQKPTLIDDAFENNLAVIADPKMLMSASFDDSGFVLMDESAATGMAEDTQTLIEEMESFLMQHEQTSQVKEEEVKVQEEIIFPSANDSGLDLLEQVMEEVDMMPVQEPARPANNAVPSLTIEESEQAEAILDALIKGDLTTDFEGINTADIEVVDETATTITQAPVVVTQPKKQPIFSGINNISEVVTADGQKIVIVIANDMPAKAEAISTIKAQVAATAVPMKQPVSEFEDDSSDSDWTPDSPTASRKTTSSGRHQVQQQPSKTKGVTAGRVAKQRGPYSKRAHASVKDKKERKKLQNVEAARRYRDKKKAEQGVIETEEEILERKNKSLKGTLSEMQNELKTLKKLMTELGLVK